MLVMLKYDPKLPLFSLHVPKTGGSTLISVLPLWFPTGHVLFHYGRLGPPTGDPLLDHGRAPLPPRKYDLGSRDIIHGHFINGAGIGLTDYYPEAKQCVA